jgi:peptidoglycan/xylan/chitin deacetylase (PgdA/CDA1 family)
MGSSLVVLGWHNVDPTWFFPARPGAGRRGLQRQLAFLRRAASVVPLAEALDALAAGRPLPPRAVALTFDDGYADNLHLAVPVLERLGLPATFFLVPDLLSGMVAPWWEVLAWAFARSSRATLTWEGRLLDLDDRAGLERAAELLKRRPQAAREAAVKRLVDLCDPVGAPDERALLLDWDGARRLARRGFAIGSHSRRHAILTAEPAAEQEQDLAGSRRALESGLGVEVRLLAYPNGLRDDYDQTTVAAARLAGYTHAVTTVRGVNRPTTPPYEIRRFIVQPERGVAGLARTPLHALRDRLPAAART